MEIGLNCKIDACSLPVQVYMSSFSSNVVRKIIVPIETSFKISSTSSSCSKLIIGKNKWFRENWVIRSNKLPNEIVYVKFNTMENT